MSYPSQYSSSSSRPNLPPIGSVLGYDPPRLTNHTHSSSRTASSWGLSSGNRVGEPSYPPNRSTQHPSIAHSSHSSRNQPYRTAGSSSAGGSTQPVTYEFDNFRPSSHGFVRINERDSSGKIESGSSTSGGPQRLVKWATVINVEGGRPEEVNEAQSPNDDGKRYECKVCKKRFSRPSSLQTHENTHTGVQPYSCTYPGCGKTFNVSSNMKRHMRGHESSGSSFQ